ncbi:hypothetical protein FSP39_022610 [Pinctada imbricata]|uniref:Male-enhanced antigen 1 n=1 Tax=Pinctada imbricata TaxID=66713 RepID=A0AA88XWX9_PINIB|nr:hypothetical protein FSP39_022610 [Pinctada imbricata]
MAPSPEENDKGPNQNPENEPMDVMDAPNFIIDQQSSDSEDEDGNDGMLGYQMLPQNPCNEDSESDSNDTEEGDPQGASPGSDRLGNSDISVTESDIDRATLPEGLHTEGGRTPSYMQVPDLPRPLPKELLWNQSHDPGRDISLDAEQSNKIKLSMSKITLPQNNIPDWAKDISDDQWKEKLQQMQRRVHDN